MKTFKIMAEDLQKLGDSVVRGSSKTGYTTVALKIEDNKMRMMSYGTTTYFDGEIPIEIVEDGENLGWQVVDFSHIRSVLSVLPKENEVIIFRSDSTGYNFRISTSLSEINLKTELGDTVQSPPEITTILDVNAADFTDTLQKITKVVDPDPINTAGAISCLHLYIKENNITMMGTNRVAMAEKIIPHNSNIEEEKSYLLHGQECSLLYSEPVDGETEWQLITDGIRFGYRDQNDFIFMIGAMNETPIEYEYIKRLVANEDDDRGYYELIIDAKDLKKGISNISRLSASSTSIHVKFSKENGTTVRSDENDIFEVNCFNEIEADGEMGLYRNAIQSLYPLFTDRVRLYFPEKLTNIVLGIAPMEKVIDEENSTPGNIVYRMDDQENVFICISTDGRA